MLHKPLILGASTEGLHGLTLAEREVHAAVFQGGRLGLIVQHGATEGHEPLIEVRTPTPSRLRSRRGSQHEFDLPDRERRIRKAEYEMRQFALQVTPRRRWIRRLRLRWLSRRKPPRSPRGTR
jgi:hypothetical protein